MVVRKESIAQVDVGKIFKAFHKGEECGYRKIRGVFGFSIDKKYEYYEYDMEKKKWKRVQRLQYCDHEDWEYEPIGRLEWLTIFGNRQEEKITPEDIVGEIS